jgi:hypothetical protein
MTVTHRKGRRASRPVMAGHASLHAIGPGLVLLLHAAKSGGGLLSRGGCQACWHSTIFPSFYLMYIIVIRTEDNRPFGLASRKRCWRVLPCWMRSAEDLANIS